VALCQVKGFDGKDQGVQPQTERRPTAMNVGSAVALVEEGEMAGMWPGVSMARKEPIVSYRILLNVASTWTFGSLSKIPQRTLP
jgi:hypothetical protein